jgi:quercetin dioxygenase-like cupin family protein
LVTVKAVGQEAPPNAAAGDFAGGAKVFSLGAVEAVKQANGSSRKAVFDGRLATGEFVSAHESWAPAGTAAPAPHVIRHSEVIVVIEGAMELWHDGRVDKAVAGDVIYVAYGTNHAVRNVGDSVARFLVFQMGGDRK